MIIRKDKKSTFSISSLPREILLSKNNKNSSNNYKEIIYIISGEGKFLIDHNEYILSSNSMCLIANNKIFNFLKGKNLVGYSIKYKNEFIPSSGLSYNTSFYSKLNGYISDIDYIKYDDFEKQDIKNHFDVLLREYDQPDFVFTSKSIVQYLFISLILKIERKARHLVINSNKSTTSNIEKKIYKNFSDLLEDNFMSHHNVSFYAEKLGVSSRKLSDSVKHCEKTTAKKYILNRVILESKRLLSYSNKSIKEICFDLGYDNPSYFTNQFKDCENLTPSQFRRNSNCEN